MKKKNIILSSLICAVLLADGIGVMAAVNDKQAEASGAVTVSTEALTEENVSDKGSTEETDSAELDFTTPWKSASGAEVINCGSASLIAPFADDAEKLKKDGCVTVRGKVISTEIVYNGSTVYTKSALEIEECFKGELKEGDIIYIREMGGFVSSSEYAEKICEEKGSEYSKDGEDKTIDLRIENYKVLESGEEVIMFLMPVQYTDMEEFSDCYDSIRMWQGKLLYDNETGLYIPFVPETEINEVKATAYTLEEFRNFVKSVI